MINHIQTLLLNESASVVQTVLPEAEYGYIDPTFTKVTADANIRGVYEELFSGSSSLSDRLHTVKLALPYFRDPEFANIAPAFDQRTVAQEKTPTSVFDFYVSSGYEGPKLLPVSRLLSSTMAPMAFLPSGNELLDTLLPGLQDIYSASREDSRRLSALLFAVVIHLEASRLKSMG
jgi:hypothetical protein